MITPAPTYVDQQSEARDDLALARAGRVQARDALAQMLATGGDERVAIGELQRLREIPEALVDGAVAEARGIVEQQLRRTVRRRGYLHLLTARLNYEQLQRLKSADRQELLQILHGSGYAMIQHVKHDTPEQLAELMERDFVLQQEAQASALMLFGFAMMIS